MAQRGVRRVGRRSFLAGGAALAFTASGARAQGFPSGPVKIVTSVGPGSSPDVCARVLADKTWLAAQPVTGTVDVGALTTYPFRSDRFVVVTAVGHPLAVPMSPIWCVWVATADRSVSGSSRLR